MTELAERLIREIREHGPMPFPGFMAAALYDPERGYYAQPQAGPRTGRGGDFFTSVSVGPVFGQLMAGEFCGAWERLGRPEIFTVIEAGANDGRFARDVLEWARDRRPDFFRALSYQIDEPLAACREKQRETLADFSEKAGHAREQPVAHGCFFANELLDAVPFRRVRFENGRWQELLVGADPGGAFISIPHAPADRALRGRLEWLGTDFPEGYMTEVAPAVASVVRLAADRLERGYLFFADYGYTAASYYAAERVTGTLRCYRRHRSHEDPFQEVGETDITAHVDFSLAASAGVQAGCEVLGFVDQSRFLTASAAGELKHMSAAAGTGGQNASWVRQFQMLTHPAHLGRKFHFLVLGKKTGGLEFPAGLGFARPSAVAELLREDFARDPEA